MRNFPPVGEAQAAYAKRCRRIGNPPYTGGLPRPARIARVVEENARVKTFVLRVSLEAEPGQFVMVWLPGVNEKPFSLVDAAPLTLTVARVGPFTSALHRLRAGDRLCLQTRPQDEGPDPGVLLDDLRYPSWPRQTPRIGRIANPPTSLCIGGPRLTHWRKVPQWPSP